MIHYLRQELTVPVDLEAIWPYFATPRNLNELTPSTMRFEFVAGGEEPMYAGQIIEYKVEILPGIRVRWLTEITHMEQYKYFIDEQRIGPYRLWIHEHRFEGVENGTRILDRVTYGLPFGFWGDLVHKLFVRQRLKWIFDYRAEQIKGCLVRFAWCHRPFFFAPLAITRRDRAVLRAIYGPTFNIQAGRMNLPFSPKDRMWGNFGLAQHTSANMIYETERMDLSFQETVRRPSRPRS